MDWILIRDCITAVLMIVGCLMSLAAAIGLLSFGDILSRMHAATKPQVLGLACLLMAVAVHQSKWSWLPILALIFVLQALTAPVSAHMVGRAAYRSKHLDSGTLVEDDLAAVVAYAEEAQVKPAGQPPQTRQQPRTEQP
jgi:multicomponent Na+:H+ antiporter subunit G